MSQGGRLRRGRVRIGLTVALAAGLFGSALSAEPAAAGAQKIYEQNVINVPDNTPIYTGNPACPRVPGVVNHGKVWSTLYADIDGSRYITLRFSLMTHYKTSVGTAAVAFKDLFGRSATCQELYTFDNTGEVNTLYNLACQNPYVIAGRRPNRWCTLAAMGTRPPSVDVEMEKCREPRFNGGVWGPGGYAGWHDLRDSAGRRVKLETIDLIEEADIGWLPGHITAPVYLDDFEMGFGISRVDPALQDRYVGYGKVQTAGISEYAAAVYDDWARRLGMAPINRPLEAHRRVQQAINNNEYISGVGRAGDAWRNWKQSFCNVSPWMMQALGDSPTDNNKDGQPDPLVFPQPNGTQCYAGFSLYQPHSSRGVGKMFEQFVAAGNDGRVPAELKARSSSIPMIIREAYRNTGYMALRDPLSAYETPPGPTCPLELDLGTGRNVHFVKLVKNLGAILG